MPEEDLLKEDLRKIFDEFNKTIELYWLKSCLKYDVFFTFIGLIFLLFFDTEITFITGFTMFFCDIFKWFCFKVRG